MDEESIVIASHFGKRLRELREKIGTTQIGLADLVGVHAMTINRLETGARGPSWEMVVALARALHVSCDAFLQAPVPTEEKPKRGRPRKRPE